MNIAFIHYHLMRGGVTTVIQHQVETLQEAGWNVMVLCGGPLPANFPAKVVQLPELGYDAWPKPSTSPAKTVRKIARIIETNWPSGTDVVHVHNPTLVKNLHLQEVLGILQQDGIRLLCQIHDFAEDGRPAAYSESPYTKNCHYAAINQRDHRLLRDAGLRPNGLHLLPNMIAVKERTIPRSMDGDYILYPVRAIRRKNIGEALLLSHFFEQGLSLAITLPPNSPADASSYAGWRSFAENRNLPIRFDAGIDADFSTLLRDCRYVLTTSITEGFGFTFMEPWMAGKVLWGRLLPDICKGFMDDGIELAHLYDSLQVDLDWLDAASLERRWKLAYSGAAKRFNVPVEAPDVEASWQDVSSGGRIDFGLLNETFQRQVITRVIEDTDASGRLKLMNPWLQSPGPLASAAKLIAHNSKIITNSYSEWQYGRRLMDVYRSVADIEVCHDIDKRKVSEFFLSPRDFSLLKWEAYDG